MNIVEHKNNFQFLLVVSFYFLTELFYAEQLFYPTFVRYLKN